MTRRNLKILTAFCTKGRDYDTRFQSRIPGHTSIAVRLYGPKAVMRWFASLDPGQRAAVVTKQRKEQKP